MATSTTSRDSQQELMRFSVHSIHIMDLRFCVQEAFGKEPAGIGPWCYPLGAEAQGKEKDWYREHGQRTPVIGSIDSRSSIDDRTSEAGEDRLLRNGNGVALSCAE
jgi:hypothetical protein